MALMKKTQRSFSGGQLDKDLTGRQDLNKYSQGCLTLENFKVRKQGNVIKRSGTDLVCDFTRIRGNLVTDTISYAKIIPIIQEREAGLYILFTGGRAYLISAEGAKMNDGTWDRNPFHHASPSTLAPYSIEVPFADSDLDMIDWCQSGDTIFFAHRSYPPCRIMYTNGTLEYTRIVFRQGSGTPPRISSVDKLGDKWTGTGGLVHLEYAITAVKDGVETGMSVPYATDYNAPWDVSCSIRINIDTSGLDPDSWDCFYVYKKEADVFGLIGTTSNQNAFVDISSGFAVDGTLYPPSFTNFNKSVHLRESGNKFATTYDIVSSSTLTVERKNGTGTGVSTLGTVYHARYVSGPRDSGGYRSYTDAQIQASYDALMAKLDAPGTTTTNEGTTYSNTSSKRSAANTVVFTIGSKIFSSFKLNIGTIQHHITKLTSTHKSQTIFVSSQYVGGARDSTRILLSKKYTYNETVANLGTRWTGQYSEFSACPATWFRATVEYNNGTDASPSWVTSAQFDCTAVVDQSSPGTGWVETTAYNGIRRWRRTYTDADAMWSYTDASSVIARMDANQPSVGATVHFNVPAEASGKKIRKITIYGKTGSAAGADAGLLVNGLSCTQSGAFVNTFTDSYITPDLTITPPKTEDHFINPGDYPGCVQMYSQRLVYAATANDPFKFWMSCTGDLYNFDVHEYVRASDAISASTAALEMPRINRMLVNRDLMMFSDGGEWQVAPSTGNAVAPSTISAKLQSTIGCAAWIKPLAIDSDIVFCDGSGETLLATRYNFASDGYESSNLSVLSQRIFRNNAICSMAYVQFPESTIECVLDDGTVASLVYMKEHDVCAWSHHRFGGDWRAVCVAANKSIVSGSSHCAFVARRWYKVTNANNNSSADVNEWAILAMRDIDPNDSTLLGNLRMDAVHTETVSRVANTLLGSVPQTEPVPPTPGHGETVVKIGEVREEISGATYITGDVYALGCAFKSTIKTTSPEFSDQETAQMEVKNATESEVRVIDGSDFKVRQPNVPEDKATLMKVESPIDTDREDYTVSPGDADCKMPLVGTNTIDGSIVVEHDGYLPLAILSVTTAFRIEYSNHANGGSNNGRD